MEEAGSEGEVVACLAQASMPAMPVQVNLTGGYYAGADNLKSGFPVAFSMTLLAWSLVEYGQELANAAGAPQLAYALDALKWGSDYFVRAHPSPNVLWVQVRLCCCVVAATTGNS